MIHAMIILSAALNDFVSQSLSSLTKLQSCKPNYQRLAVINIFCMHSMYAVGLYTKPFHPGAVILYNRREIAIV